MSITAHRPLCHFVLFVGPFSIGCLLIDRHVSKSGVNTCPPILEWNIIFAPKFFWQVDLLLSVQTSSIFTEPIPHIPYHQYVKTLLCPWSSFSLAIYPRRDGSTSVFSPFFTRSEFQTSSSAEPVLLPLTSISSSHCYHKHLKVHQSLCSFFPLLPQRSSAASSWAMIGKHTHIREVSLNQSSALCCHYR